MKKSLLLLLLLSLLAAPALGRKHQKIQKQGREEFLQMLAEAAEFPQSQVRDVTAEDFERYFKQNHPADLHYAHAAIALHLENLKRATSCLDSAFAAYTPKAYINEQIMFDLKLRIAAKVDPENALPEINKYIESHTSNNLAWACQMRAEIYAAQQKWDAAEADYRKVIELIDTANVARVALAKIMMQRNKNDEALEILSDCLTRFPDFASAYELRANLHQKMGEGRKAVDDMLEFAIANTRINLLDFQQIVKENLSYVAAAALKKANNRYGEGKQFMQWIAVRAYEWAKLHKEAAQLTEKMFEQNRYYSKDLCFVYFELGLYEDAVKFGKFFEKHYGDNDSEISTLGAIGSSYHALGQYEKAIEYYTMAYERQPMEPVFHQMRASTYLHMNDTVNAMKYFKAALELNPKDTASLFFRGVVYRKLGQIDKANADFQAFIKHADVSDNYMLLQCYLGNKERAVQLCDSLLRANPFDEGTHYSAACLYSNLNDKAKAIAFLRKALEYGNRNFEHIEWDFDLDNIKKTPEFKALIEEFKAKPLYVPKATLPDCDDQDSDNIEVEPLLI